MVSDAGLARPAAALTAVAIFFAGENARSLVRNILTSTHDAIDRVQGRGLLPDKPLLKIGVRTRTLDASWNRQRLFGVAQCAEIKPTPAPLAFPKTFRLAHDQKLSKPLNQ
jgi:hypothetical protein